MSNNYFVCTLGQATVLNSRLKTYHTINDFVKRQAQNHPLVPAVAFPVPGSDGNDWSRIVFSFKHVDRGTNVFAKRLQAMLGTSKDAKTVALLCHSSAEFLFTWLGLMRLGYSVLLIAPQCQPAAIVHLCKSCQASTLFHDSSHSERAQKTGQLAKEEGLLNFVAKLTPLQSGEDISHMIHESIETELNVPQRDEKAVAYLHHTSGTSSGLPKPIPQSHRAAIGVLPHLPTIPTVASFSITPLYHGGIADLFRCWTSNALIWLFPSKDVPITARNICQCLDVAKLGSQVEGLPVVRYFSSVPYVLQMMDADIKGLSHLQQMDIVGVGGAALPAEVGDRLVEKGVNLISRFGSAECGFTLSSFRDFDTDHAWQYLRNENPPALLDFEKREGGLSELVIKPGWPHMAKQNRPDGSFATADLFFLHPKIKNAWLYHSRADSQLTLITGKKFDPAPLEDALATSPLLDDVLIFGNNRPFPGVLLFRSAQSSHISDQELLAAVEPLVTKLNSDSQDHARIPLDMLVPLPHQDYPLEKSSKGTIIRRAAEARFDKVIESAYTLQEGQHALDVKDGDLRHYLTSLIQSMTSQSAVVTEDMDLFSYGVDSIACMQLRNRLRRLIPSCTGELPMSIVEDCGTIRRLTDYVLRNRHGESARDVEDEKDLMLKLVEQYGTFQTPTKHDMLNGTDDRQNQRAIIVLTGATGALGAHVLNLLLETGGADEIYCLVRGADQHAARERVSKALQQRGLMKGVALESFNDKVNVVLAHLGSGRLGLTDKLYDYLSKEATSIIHIAWTVNFRLRLQSFVKDNIAGVQNLLHLATRIPRLQPPRFTYCSSTAAIINAAPDASGYLPEKLDPDPSSASPLGYSRSKWVAEQVCLRAHHGTNLRGRISIVRVGQLAGDSVSGIWNTKEAWPMMLSTVKLIQCLPDLGNEPLDWLPVDIAALAFLQTTQLEVKGKEVEMPAYHVLNQHQTPTWQNLLQWLKKTVNFDTVAPDEWVRRLEKCEEADCSARKLLGMWKESYDKPAQQPQSRSKFAIAETKAGVPALRDVEPLDEAYVERIWGWVQENVH